MLKFSDDLIKEIISSRNKTGHIDYRHKFSEKSLSELKSLNITPRLLNHFLLNDITEYPVCYTCKKELTENQIINKKLYCSLKCAQKSDITQNKIKQTNLKKYGVDNPAKAQVIKDKINQTFSKHFQEGHPSRNKDIQKKLSESISKAYHVNHDEIIRKRKETNLKRYGTEHINTWGKAKDTIEKRYGSMNSDILKEKRIQTNLSRYGCAWAIQSPEVRNKVQISHRMNYFDTASSLLEKKNIIINMPKEDYLIADTIHYTCKSCGQSFDIKHTNPQKIVCPVCSVKYKSSTQERMIADFVKRYADIELNVRNIIDRELDIYIPEKKLAIEFNGSYWHSELYKNITYHQEKTLQCREKGIRLIQIPEYVWEYKSDIIKSIIMNALSIDQNIIYGRKCDIQTITSSQYAEFLKNNHIQGAVNSKNRLGLFYQGTLVSVFGYGTSRFKKGEIELHRFCSLLNTKVIGAFSKFLKYSDVSEMTSYVDLSYFDGAGYLYNGFTLESITKPSYVYIKRNEIYTRMQCQKHKLKNILEKFDENKTEHENMLDNGYTRYYDCGNLKMRFTKELNKNE